MKFIILAALLLPCLQAHAQGRHAPAPVPVISPLPTPLASPQEPAFPRPISLKCDSACTSAQVAEVPLIEAAMNTTLSSQCFSDYFTTPGRRIDMTGGLTPVQIVEKLRQPSNLTLNYFFLQWEGKWPFRWQTKEEGYESAVDFSVIHFNTFFTQSWSICYKASLGLHEMSHTKYFWHNGNRADINYYTVPYTANHATESCCGH